MKHRITLALLHANDGVDLMPGLLVAEFTTGFNQ